MLVLQKGALRKAQGFLLSKQVWPLLIKVRGIFVLFSGILSNVK